jgi:hypothetical protein
MEVVANLSEKRKLLIAAVELKYVSTINEKVLTPSK